MTPAQYQGWYVPTGGWSVYRRSWRWLLTLGIISVLLGVIAVFDSILATIASMIFFGWVLLIAGIVEAVHAFRNRRSGHLLLHSLNAILSIVVGVMLLGNPLAGALVITLLLAAYFTVTGIFRIVSALSLRFPHWGWALANGIITLLLGILVWVHWPGTAFWIIGLFIGIHLIVTGWAEVMFALAVRRFVGEPPEIGKAAAV